MENGNLTLALKALRKYGACSESVFSENKIGLIQTQKSIAESVPKVNCDQNRSFASLDRLSADVKALRDLNVDVYMRSVGRLTRSNASIESKARAQRLMKGLVKLCPSAKRTRVTFPEPKQTLMTKPTNLEVGLNQIAKTLKEGLPVGINLDSALLNEGYGYSGSANHYAMIIGSRSKGGTCELLVGNSYGKSCEHAPKQYSCWHGDLWIPAARVQEATAYVHWIPGT